jgi:PGF-pre-PGF domain-containing protein
MRKDFLPFLIFLLTISYASAASFIVSVTPSTINASRKTLLTFSILNLNNTQNITQINITLPNGFSYESGLSSTSGICNWNAPSLITCSGSPLIANNSRENISFYVNSSVVSPPQYSFLFDTLDTSNEITHNSTNITVNDIDAPIILSVFPGNQSVKYQENGIYVFNASFSDNIMLNSTEFFWNGLLEQTNYTSSKTFSIQIVKTGLGVGNYNYSWRVNDTSGNWNSSIYFFNITQANNPLTFYLNDQKNQNITIENGTTVNITILAKGNISVWLNENLLGTPREGIFNTSYLFDSIGEYKIFANATGNQNYTTNSTGASFFVKVIYPRLRFKDLQAPSSATYSPGASYTFKITFFSLAYPLNNITNVSFIFNDKTYYLPVSKQDNETYSFTVKDLAAGSYNWRFCAEDSQEEFNCTSGTLSITQATPQLNILNVQDYLVPVNKTIIAIGCPSQLVCKFYLNDTELTHSYYELITDKPGYYIFTFNTSGNANYSAALITKSLTVYPSRQATTTTIIQTTTTTTIQPTPSTSNLLDLQPNSPTVFRVGNPDLLKVSEIEITAREEVKNVEVKVEIPLATEIPKEFVEEGKAYLTYLKIALNISSEKIASIKIRFKVEKTWINAKNIDETKIALYKFENENWIEQPTQKISEDENNVYYETSLSSLSFFVIAGKIKAGFPWHLALIPIVIIIVGIIVYLFWPTPIGSEYEKLKQKWSSGGFGKQFLFYFLHAFSKIFFKIFC